MAVLPLIAMWRSGRDSNTHGKRGFLTTKTGDGSDLSPVLIRAIPPARIDGSRTGARHPARIYPQLNSLTANKVLDIADVVGQMQSVGSTIRGYAITH